MCHFATLLALASLRSRRTAIIPAYSCRRHPRLKVYPHLPHKPHAQTSRIDPPIKHPLNYLASHNSLAIICRRRVSLKPPVPLLATPLPAIFRNENPGIKRLRKRPGTRINMPRKRPKQGSRNEDPGTKRLKTRASTP